VDFKPLACAFACKASKRWAPDGSVWTGTRKAFHFPTGGERDENDAKIAATNSDVLHLIYRARFSPIITPARESERGEAEMQTRRVPDTVHAAEHTEKHVTLIYSRGPGRGRVQSAASNFSGRDARGEKKRAQTDQKSAGDGDGDEGEEEETHRVHLLHISRRLLSFRPRPG
jgi:hypothetical protein